MDNINSLTKIIYDKAQAENDALLDNARAEAKRIVDGFADRARAELPRIESRFKARAREIISTGQLREKMERQRILSAARQELVDDLISLVRDRYTEMDDARRLALMRSLLAKSIEKANGEKPVILVPAHQLDSTAAEFGDEFEVYSGDFEAGFIISYKNYNLNYEAQRLFINSREELEIYAMRLLFEENADA